MMALMPLKPQSYLDAITFQADARTKDAERALRVGNRRDVEAAVIAATELYLLLEEIDRRGLTGGPERVFMRALEKRLAAIDKALG